MLVQLLVRQETVPEILYFGPVFLPLLTLTLVRLFTREDKAKTKFRIHLLLLFAGILRIAYCVQEYWVEYITDATILSYVIAFCSIGAHLLWFTAQGMIIYRWKLVTFFDLERQYVYVTGKFRYPFALILTLLWAAGLLLVYSTDSDMISQDLLVYAYSGLILLHSFIIAGVAVRVYKQRERCSLAGGMQNSFDFVRRFFVVGILICCLQVIQAAVEVLVLNVDESNDTNLTGFTIVTLTTEFFAACLVLYQYSRVRGYSKSGISSIDLNVGGDPGAPR